MGYIGYCGDSIALVKTSQGVLMYVDMNNCGISPHLANTGNWEDHIVTYLTSQDLKQKICFDAGASFGFYTFLFSHLGAKKVYAVEPQLRAVKLLYMGQAIHPKTDFVIMKAALSDKAGEDLPFYEQTFNTGGSRVVDPGDNKHTTTVISTSIDYMNIPRIDFLKIDVEGYEDKVLLGGENTILNSPDIKIIMEWNPSYADSNVLFPIWDKLNLKPQVVGKGKNKGKPIPFDPTKLDKFQDIILTHK